MKSKIAIIVCWMGKLPEWFDLWKKSCEYNPDFDWLFFTDQPIQGNAQDSNVKMLSTTIDALKKRCREKLNLEMTGLTSPYKLCDLKPTYGLIFEEELSEGGYSHWGHCDIDQIFGEISSFISDEMLACYDKLYSKGHLSIYRNTEEINRRVFDSESLFELGTVVNDPCFYAFDEHTGIERIYKRRGYAYYDKYDFIDVSVRHKTSLRFNRESYNKERQAFYWERGKMYRVYIENDEICQDEWLYLHFQKKPLKVLISDKDCDAFWITPEGFVDKTQEPVTQDDILKYNSALTKKQLKTDNRDYFSFKMSQFMKKSLHDKYIHIRQRASRIFK